MRDVKRIDVFTKELNGVWKYYFPDWRFGQLMSNFLGWLSTTKGIDIFFPEEDAMLRYLKEFCGEMSNE